MLIDNPDNTVAVLQQLVDYYRIRVSRETVSNDLVSHPTYPSLKSVSDAFTRWKTENYAVEIDQSELLELTDPFLAHIKEEKAEKFLTVYRVSEAKVVYAEAHGKRRSMKLAEFLAKWDGIVLMINPRSEAGEKDYAQKRQNEHIKNSLLPLGIVTYVCTGGYFFTEAAFADTVLSVAWWSLLATKTIGVILTVLAIRVEQGKRNEVLDKLCHFGKQSDCKAIINDKEAHVYGWISLAGAGLVYFLASLMAMLILGGHSDTPLAALAGLSILTIPVCGYSIYYQWAVGKKWCPLCLGIVVVLLVEFALLYPHITVGLISVGDLIVLALIFLAVSVGLLVYTAFMRAETAAFEATSSFLKLKRDPLVFEHALTRTERKDLPIGPHSFVVGDPEAPSVITAFLSLTCNPCKREFMKLDELLATTSSYKLDVVLSAKDAVVFDQFRYIYLHQGPAVFLDALRDWYASNGKVDLKAVYHVPDDYSRLTEAQQAHINHYIQANIEYTPTIFVQGYKFPKGYEVVDLAYLQLSDQASLMK